MKHLDLFSGIGGFALAARWMGWETVQFVEIDKFCHKVLNKNFPNVPIHDDIKTFDGTKYRGTVDVLTGGFPCQPYSSAGKRLGKEDERHLWPEMLRVIGEVQPTFIVGENVYGLVNWSRGMVFNEVQADLENQGYEVAPVILPACAVDAPHRRDRVWFVAYTSSERVGRPGSKCDTSRELLQESEREQGQLFDKCFGGSGIVTNTKGERCGEAWQHSERSQKRITCACCEWNATDSNEKGIQGRQASRNFESKGANGNEHTGRHYQFNDWGMFPTQSPVCRRDDGVPNRVERLKTLGNAIVPQVAFEIFKAIETSKG